MHAHSSPVFSKIAFTAFFVAAFMLFTPFEDAGSNPTMLPKYLAAGVAMLCLAPLALMKHLRLRPASLLVLILLLALDFHGSFIKPVPLQFALLVTANLVLAIAMYETHFAYRKEFEAAIGSLLAINAVAIFIQVIIFYFFTHSIYDVHRLVFGSESRVTEEFLNIARFSGLHVEPGTYTNYLSCLIIIYVFSADFSRKVAWIALASLFSILLTHSASAIFFVLVIFLLLWWLWRDRVGFWQVLGIVAAVALYVYASNFVAHLQNRFLQGEDGSLSLKLLGIHTYLRTGLEEKMIGIGFAANPCGDCHYQDIGVVLNLLSRGGIILAFALLLILGRSVYLHGLILSVLMFSIPVYCIISFYETPIWLVILFATTSKEMLDKRRTLGAHDHAGARPAHRFAFAGTRRPFPNQTT
ncbi:MAG: hypothetical protein QFF03_02535 [Pseudomonadota bacterium]|nr:hypothetical protein [Pseudomonadota bacterium]